MRRILKLRDHRRFENSFRQLLNEIGGVIHIYRDNPNKQDCPKCGWDPYSKTGLDPNCARCGGVGKIALYLKYDIHDVAIRWFDGSVVWGRTTAGRYEVGDCRLTMELEKVLKNPSVEGSDTFFHDAIKVTVDGVDCEVKSPVVKKGFNSPFLCTVIVSRIS